MAFHPLGRSSIERSPAGEFRTQVAGNLVHLSRDVFDAFQAVSVETAEEMLSTLHAFPSGIAKLLGWSVEQVEEAREALIKDLASVVDDHYLEPPQPAKRVYGVVGRGASQDDA